jgi:hypothetical protein
MKIIIALFLFISLSSEVTAQTEKDLIHLLAGDDLDGEKIWLAHDLPLRVDLSMGETCQNGEEHRYSPKGRLVIRTCIDGKVNIHEAHWSLAVDGHHAVITIDEVQYQFNPYKKANMPENTYLELISISEVSNRPFKYNLLIHSEL